MAANNQNDGLISGINVTPLVDVTLVLLIIFIVTAKMIMTPSVPLDLPQAKTSEELQVIFSVTIPLSGAIYVDGEQVQDDASIVARAKQAMQRDNEIRAVISADGGVSHRQVIHVLDLLKLAGIAHVAFGAVPEKP
jgi:biopolymer transport protein TolR